MSTSTLTYHDCSRGVEITFEYTDRGVVKTQVMFEEPVPLEQLFNSTVLMNVRSALGGPAAPPPPPQQTAMVR